MTSRPNLSSIITRTETKGGKVITTTSTTPHLTHRTEITTTTQTTVQTLTITIIRITSSLRAIIQMITDRTLIKKINKAITRAATPSTPKTPTGAPTRVATAGGARRALGTTNTLSPRDRVITGAMPSILARATTSMPPRKSNELKL